MKSLDSTMQGFLAKIKFTPILTFSEEELQDSFSTILGRINSSAQIQAPTHKKTTFFYSSIFKIACSIAIIAVVSFFGMNYLKGSQEIIIANNTQLVKDYNLPDGSKVWLRLNSSLAYSKDFTNQRNVTLEGEAVFEVMKDSKHPFAVATKFGNVTVLGTVFSVRSFPEENFTKTILKEGSVSMSDNSNNTVILKPGEQGIINENVSSVEVSKIQNIERQFAWQSRKFEFENESLDVIVAVVSETFNKKIIISNKALSNKRFTLKLNRNESLTRVMDVLAQVAGFKYKELNDSIVID